MVQFNRFLLVSLLSREVATQSTSVTSIFFADSPLEPSPFFNVQASVISVQPTQTAYLLNLACGSTLREDPCAALTSVILVQGPSTIALEATVTSDSSTLVASRSCDITSDTATCHASAVGPDRTEGGTVLQTTIRVEVTTITDIHLRLTPITITAGLEKLSAQSSGPTPSLAAAPGMAAEKGFFACAFALLAIVMAM